MSNKNKNIYMGTKAETLFLLSKLGYNIPKVYYFTVNEWKNSKKDILNKILSTFKNTKKVAIDDQLSVKLIDGTISIKVKKIN